MRQAESVEDTLRYLQKDMALLVYKEAGYEAENGDALPLVPLVSQRGRV